MKHKLKRRCFAVVVRLAEIASYCDSVQSGKLRMEDSFFTDINQVSKLRIDCAWGRAEDVLGQLYGFRGGPGTALFITNLEAALADEAGDQPPGNDGHHDSPAGDMDLF